MGVVAFIISIVISISILISSSSFLEMCCNRLRDLSADYGAKALDGFNHNLGRTNDIFTRGSDILVVNVNECRQYPDSIHTTLLENPEDP